MATPQMSIDEKLSFVNDC